MYRRVQTQQAVLPTPRQRSFRPFVWPCLDSSFPAVMAVMTDPKVEQADARAPLYL